MAANMADAHRRAIVDRLGGVIAGQVQLTRRDGSIIQVDLEVFSDIDRQWIEDRGWERDAEKIEEIVDPTPQ